jgi:hypothetical protein
LAANRSRDDIVTGLQALAFHDRDGSQSTAASDIVTNGNVDDNIKSLNEMLVNMGILPSEAKSSCSSSPSTSSPLNPGPSSSDESTNLGEPPDACQSTPTGSSYAPDSPQGRTKSVAKDPNDDMLDKDMHVGDAPVETRTGMYPSTNTAAIKTTINKRTQCVCFPSL